MKKILQKISLFILGIFCSSFAFAYDFKVDNIFYSIINIQEQTCRVVNNGGANDALNSYSGHIVIPETVTFNGRTFKVIELGDMGYNPSLLSLAIGNGVTKIAYGACDNASNLVELSIGNSVVSIGEDAFNGCSKLKNIVIPSNVTQLYTDCFCNCPSVESLILEESDANLNFWFGNGYSRPFEQCEFKNVFIGRETHQNGFVGLDYESEIANLLYNKKLESITIGSNIKNFDYQLKYATNLRKITCLATTPPFTSNTTTNRFSPTQYQNIVLYVPKGTKELYKVAPLWENFWNIVESDNGVTIDELSLDETTVSLNVGETYRINYHIFPINADNVTLEWSSNNQDIAYVDSYGNITGLKTGTAIITAKTKDGSNISASCSVTVTQKMENITLNNYSLSLFEGESKLITATAHPLDATSAIEWYSSNTDICTVDAKGLISAVSKGEATVVAKCSSDPSIFAVCNITVNRHVEGIVLSNSEITLSVDTDKQLYATVYPESANNKEVIWISENPSIASVNEFGLVSAKSCGETTIKAISVDRPELSASCTVAVEALISNLILTPSHTTLSEGETMQITASVFPEYANNKTLKWSSSDEKVAIVNQDGKVTAVAKGTVIITAKTTDGSDISATCEITVKKLVSSIDISHTSVCLGVGCTEIITAFAIPSDATNTILKWYSEDENIAIVDNGVIHAISEGKTNVIVETTDGSNVKETCEVEVTGSTGFSKASNEKANIHVDNSTIYISNVPISNLVRIFNSDGFLVYKGSSCKDTIKYKPSAKGVYIVVLQSKPYKVATPVRYNIRTNRAV